ncbi:MAG: hypothetical protein BA874_10535 [Desulfuromonadales bacterium C00003068]|jgi:subtilisin family serine protease|nr:MAG: hypothetical protein BA874_10535 [Desulfuromonadales bacterium C00003068]
MSKQKQEPPYSKLDEEILQKMDGNLRRLLRMTDNDILKEVDDYETRRAKRINEIGRLVDILPPTASYEDRQAVKRVQNIYRNRLLPHPVFSVLRIKPKPIKVRAIALFTGNRDDLIGMGLEVGSQAHDIFTIVGTKEQLADLAAQPATLRVSLPNMLLPDVDEATGQAEVTAVHAMGSPDEYRGNGVIVGIIDSAIDVTHHAFRDPDTHDTRVLYYWVQCPDDPDQPGYTPSSYAENRDNMGQDSPVFQSPFGRIYDSEYINAAINLLEPYGDDEDQISCRLRDEDLIRHGTSVAGIAAGNGLDSDWNETEWIGAAPLAKIVHVNVYGVEGEGDCTAPLLLSFDDRIMKALDFIFAVADHEDMPVVINLSMSDQCGSHRGNSALPNYIDEKLTSWRERSVVGSVGNYGDTRCFLRGSISPGGDAEFTLTKPTYADPESDLSLSIWSIGRVLEVRVVYGDVDTGMIGVYTNEHGCVSRESDFRIIEPPMCRIKIETDNVAPGDSATIHLHDPWGEDEVTYYAWVCKKSGDLDPHIEGEFNLSDHACCKSMLTVGACAKWGEWPDNYVDASAGEPIAYYSSAGPTVDRRIKPEIVAVGGVAEPGREHFGPVSSATFDLDSGYLSGQGTSLSAPLVAGSVALLFEEARHRGHPLDQETIKALLTQNANRQGINLDDPADRNRYGYGRLRMMAPFVYIQENWDIDVYVRTAEDDFGEVPYRGDIECEAPEIKVYREDAPADETTEVYWGLNYNISVTVRNLGGRDAEGTTVRLYYTLPHVAPHQWKTVENESGEVQERIDVDVPALDRHRIDDFHWCPNLDQFTEEELSEDTRHDLPTHFCLLAVVEHDEDSLPEGMFGEEYRPPNEDGWDPFTYCVRHLNNVALLNVHILSI